MAETTIPTMDRLTGQLYHMPGMIAALGIGIANAQAALNADYLHNVEKILDMIGKLLKDVPPDTQVETVKELLGQLAPSRYQFTETTFEFRADLAESQSKRLQAELGVGFSGVVVSAAYSKAYGYNYEAAARISTVLHAFPLQGTVMSALLGRAGDIDSAALKAPARYTDIDKEMLESLENIRKATANIEKTEE